jgi:programmed cell death protein 4
VVGVAGKGFERLLESIDDLSLDAPDARAVAARFLARAVSDEVLPPAFLSSEYVMSLAGDVVEEAKVSTRALQLLM